MKIFFILLAILLMVPSAEAEQSSCSTKGCSATASVSFSITIPLCVWTMPDGSTIDNSSRIIDKAEIANAVSVRCVYGASGNPVPTISQSTLASP